MTTMKFIVTFVAVTAVLFEVQGKNLSPGHQILNNSLYSPQPAPQRYATKEIILYLTPSQIRALEQGKGSIDLSQVRHAEHNTHAQEQTSPQAVAHQESGKFEPHQSSQVHPQFEHPQSFQLPTRPELQSGPFIPISPPLDYRKPASVYNNFQPQNQKRFLKPIPFFPDAEKVSPDNERKTLPASTPQEFFQEKGQDTEITHQQLKEQWLNLLNKNIAHFKALEALTQNQRASSENKTNFHYLSHNAHIYNNQKDASEVYNLVRSNNEHQFKKQQALLRSEAIANSSPILVHKEINIKHIPHLIAHVPVPVPTPVFVPVNAPRTYEIPLEILGVVPIPINKPQINDGDRLAPTPIKKHVPIPTKKNADVDRPFFSVPVHNQAPNQGSWPVHSHEWHH